jgi:hypothetical protein
MNVWVCALLHYTLHFLSLVVVVGSDGLRGIRISVHVVVQIIIDVAEEARVSSIGYR